MKQLKSNLPYLLVVIIGVFALASLFNRGGTPSREISYTEFRQILDNRADTVKLASTDDTFSKVLLEFKDGSKKFVTLSKNLSGDLNLLNDIAKSGIDAKVVVSKTEGFMFIFWQWFPMLLLLGLFFFFARGLQAGGGQAFNFIKSKAKLMGEQKVKVTFDDVAGVEEAKKELQEVVEFLKDGAKFKALGAKIPKGVLLVGPPGTGKTLLAKAIAGEAGVPFFSISGSDFVEMFVGVGASRVRDLFEQARKQAPCIVFVDEIDAVGRQRGGSGFGGHDEREQTLNQLLVEMDGFEGNSSSVIILAATNRPDVLDSALTRPGRFDRQVMINYPDAKGREDILRVHSKGKVMRQPEDIKVLAKRTPGFTGAQLANVMNEAALIAAIKDKKEIDRSDLDEAVDKVYMGTKRSLSLHFKELELTAYHETGHALVAIYDDNAMPLHKLTIIPRGMALGVTWYLPKDDSQHITKRMLLSRIKAALGGRVAEEIVFGDITTGAASDLQACTGIARRMVTQFGMSDLGPVAFGRERENFMGDFGMSRDYSENVAELIDKEVQRIIEECLAEVRELLSKKRAVMDAISFELLEKETLDREEVEEIVRQVEASTFNFDQAREKVASLKEKMELRERENDNAPSKEIAA